MFCDFFTSPQGYFKGNVWITKKSFIEFLSPSMKHQQGWNPETAVSWIFERVNPWGSKIHGKFDFWNLDVCLPSDSQIPTPFLAALWQMGCILFVYIYIYIWYTHHQDASHHQDGITFFCTENLHLWRLLGGFLEHHCHHTTTSLPWPCQLVPRHKRQRDPHQSTSQIRMLKEPWMKSTASDVRIDLAYKTYVLPK